MSPVGSTPRDEHRAMDNAPLPAMQLIGLRARFGATEVIRGADLVVAAGERHAIIGPNGAGKSTLFRLASGQLAPDAGRVLLGGRDITGMPAHAVARLGLARSFQVSSLFTTLTVFENLRCATLWPLGHRHAFWKPLGSQRDARDRAEAMLERIGLAARRDVPAGELSYAEQRALELGIAVAGGAHTLLLDEPTAGMSRAETEAATRLIRELSAGRTLLMVEHDMEVVFGLADRVSVLVAGQFIATGTPAEVRADARVREAYLGSGLSAGEEGRHG